MKFEIFQKDLFFTKNCISKFNVFRIYTGLEESYKIDSIYFLIAFYPFKSRDFRNLSTLKNFRQTKTF